MKNKMEMWLLLLFFVTTGMSLTDGEISKVQDKYTTKYDNVNLDDILNSKRLLANYVKCLLGDGPCTADGAELKKSVPDAIQTNCSKCSDKQREGSEQVIHHLIEHEPEVWERLEKLYDPDGEYKKRYMDEKGVQIIPAPNENAET